MPNASPKGRGPNATYIPPAHVGGRLGKMGIALGTLGVAFGPQEFLATNMLVYPTRRGSGCSRIKAYEFDTQITCKTGYLVARCGISSIPCRITPEMSLKSEPNFFLNIHITLTS